MCCINVLLVEKFVVTIKYIDDETTPANDVATALTFVLNSGDGFQLSILYNRFCMAQ